VVQAFAQLDHFAVLKMRAKVFGRKHSAKIEWAANLGVLGSVLGVLIAKGFKNNRAAGQLPFRSR